jgi:hypothetical protein
LFPSYIIENELPLSPVPLSVASPFDSSASFEDNCAREVLDWMSAENVDDVDLLPDKPDDQPIIAQWYVWIRE